jgi:hypothetical protein
MPKRIAAEMTCARCTRIWYADYNPESQNTSCAALELTLKNADGKERKFSFDALCDVCARAVNSYIDLIGEKLVKASPNRKARAKKKVEETTLQLSPPPVSASPSLSALPASVPSAVHVAPAAAAPLARVGQAAAAGAVAGHAQSTQSGPRPMGHPLSAASPRS